MAFEMAQQSAGDASSFKAPATMPSMSGWLLKRKSEGARSRLISDTNRRYFTLDFNTQVFFYSQKEDTKQVSYPVAFRDILGVESLAQAAEEEAPVVRTNSKISLASKVFGSKQAKEQHGFLLRTPGKCMELICSSAEEAERWVSALTTACAIGQGAPLPGQGEPTGERSTTPGSLASGQLQNEDGFNLVEVEQHEQDEPAGEPVGLLPPRPLALAADQDAQEIPPQAMTMMSLSSEMEKMGAREAFPQVEPSRADPLAPEPEVATVPTPIEPERVQEADGIGKLSPRGQEASCSAWGVGLAPAGPPAGVKYCDRGEGLTLQQRLAQLDFSDDEDEADEPAPLGSAEPVPAPAEAIPSTAGAPVEHEACQAFVAPESDGED